MSNDVLKSTTAARASNDAAEQQPSLAGYTMNDLLDAGEAYFGALGGASLAKEFRGEFITTFGNPEEKQALEPSKEPK